MLAPVQSARRARRDQRHRARGRDRARPQSGGRRRRSLDCTTGRSKTPSRNASRPSHEHLREFPARDRHRRNSRLDDRPGAESVCRICFKQLLDQHSSAARSNPPMRRRAGWCCSADGLIERQPDTEELVTGPPMSAGDGAAAGFAKKQGAPRSTRIANDAQRRVLQFSQNEPKARPPPRSWRANAAPSDS